MRRWAMILDVVFAPSGYGSEPAPRDLTFTFWLHERGEFQKIEPREVEREGDRFFVVTLPGGAVRRLRQYQSGATQWVDSIPGGDPD
jgi:hypothetical protein